MRGGCRGTSIRQLLLFPGYGDALLFNRRGGPKPAYAAVVTRFANRDAN